MEPNNLINKDLDIQSLKEEYQKEKFIVIKNFLQIEEAEKLSTYYNEKVPADWWSWMFLPDPDLGLENWSTNVYPEDGSKSLQKLIATKKEIF